MNAYAKYWRGCKGGGGGGGGGGLEGGWDDKGHYGKYGNEEFTHFTETSVYLPKFCTTIIVFVISLGTTLQIPRRN